MSKKNLGSMEPSKTKRAAHFRKRLLERYYRLLQGRRSVEGAEMNPLGPARETAPRIMVDTYEEEVAHHVFEMRLEEIQEIEDALRKISEGEYGVCEDCGERIPAARLRAIPSASVCVNCQEKREWRRRVERARAQSGNGVYASLGSAMAQASME